MSDLNDDLLNYELGDDIDDQALCGDEDELLLSDEELEKDVSNEEKQQIKAEAVEWVNTQIQEKDEQQLKPIDDTPYARSFKQVENENSENNKEKSVATELGNHTSDAGEVTSTAAGAVEIPTLQSEFSDNVSTSAEFPQKSQINFKEPMQSQQQNNKTAIQTVTHSSLSSADEVSSSCNKEQEPDHSSVISCSTNAQTDSSSYIQSSQESSSYGFGQNSPIYSDPREDIEEEREERTNIKVTNERDTDYVVDNLSPEKQSNRFLSGKRGGPPSLIRPHNIRGSYHGQRPQLRFPHGNFHHMSQPFGSMATVSTTLTHTSNPLIPGQFLHNPYAPHSPHGGPGPQHPTQSMNTQNPMHPHQPDPMNHNLNQRPRHAYPPYRPNVPLGFRHPNPNMFSPEYQVANSSYNQNFGPQGSPVYRPELPSTSVGGVGMPTPNLRAAVRMQRPPLQNMPLHGMVPNYVNSPPMRLSQPPQAQNPLQMQPGAVPNSVSAVPAPGQNPGTLAAPSSAIQQTGAIRPSKVLINPNFKGGVEAAKNKFIKDTQFMTTISNHVSHLQSDEELLRQQEEFINKNREHIEKRRNERKSPSSLRRSRSMSRTRSRSRDRSYSPKRGNGNASHFDRDRDRDRIERLDRANVGSERYADRDRDRGNGSGAMSRGNRFRRGNSRDRDYENRNTGIVNYAKRRRSVSPHLVHRSAPGGVNNTRRGSDREKNNVEEDEETRAYRMEIEKQKALREKILRDKEIKRRKAAEEKQYEEKRAMQPNSNNKNIIDEGSQQQQQQQQSQIQSQQQLQKLKPIIVTERKIISLKKRQIKDTDDIGKQKKLLPTAKIPPEAKRTITEHLTNSANVGGNSGPNNIHANTAIIKPVQKKDLSTHAHTPPIVKQSRRLSTPSDDEVELDYDEDELMLEEEDRLLATPTPSPPHTPSPDLSSRITSTSTLASNNKFNSSARSSGSSQKATSSSMFSSSNRRVVLKSSSSTSSCRKDLDNNRHGSGSSVRGKNDGHNTRKVIIERVYLDTRKQMKVGNADNRRQGHRSAVKHD